MSVGLPGLGLGGLFFVISALVAPLVELHRSIQGRSSAVAWRQVGRQFSIAVVMVVAVGLALGITSAPLAPIGVTAALLAALLLGAKVLQLAMRVADHRRATRPAYPRRSPRSRVRAAPRLEVEPQTEP
jgi:hypothetical protein